VRSKLSISMWPGIVVVTGLVVGGCGLSAESQETTVNALWYGKQQDGSFDSGLTPVTIATTAGSGSDFTVDLDGLRAASTGDVWNAAAWSAATVGTLGSGVDPRGVSVNFGVGESIDGPSAGGLMTVGVLADLAGSSLNPEVTMTGTILPSGAIGPVGGIPEKLRAAASAGMETVLIPEGQRYSVDPRTSTTVDVVQEGEDLGVDVVEVRSVRQALARITGETADAVISEIPPLNQELTALLQEQTAFSMKRLASMDVAPASTPASEQLRQRTQRSVEVAQNRVPQLLAEGRNSDAFARSTLTERALLGWNARIAALDPRTDLTTRADVLTASATSLAQTAADLTAQFAATQVNTVEQIAALPDALSWGTDAYAIAASAAAFLTDPATSTRPEELGQIASDLANAQYDLDRYLPICVTSVGTLGGPGSAGVPPQGQEQLAAYANLLSEAGAANLEYFRRTAAAESTTETDALRSAKVLEARLNGLPTADSNDQAAVLTRLSSALSYFVLGTELVAASEATTEITASQATDSKLAITNQRAFDLQVDVATTQTNTVAAELGSRGIDASYLHWNNQWGRAMATVPAATGATDQLREEGLTLQWYSNIQGDILTMLTTQP